MKKKPEINKNKNKSQAYAGNKSSYQFRRPPLLQQQVGGDPAERFNAFKS